MNQARGEAQEEIERFLDLYVRDDQISKSIANALTIGLIDLLHRQSATEWQRGYEAAQQRWKFDVLEPMRALIRYLADDMHWNVWHAGDDTDLEQPILVTASMTPQMKELYREVCGGQQSI